MLPFHCSIYCFIYNTYLIFKLSPLTLVLWLPLILLVLLITVEEASCAYASSFATIFIALFHLLSLYLQRHVYWISFLLYARSLQWRTAQICFMISHAFIVIAIQTFHWCWLFMQSVLFFPPLHLSFLFSLLSGILFSLSPRLLFLWWLSLLTEVNHTVIELF